MLKACGSILLMLLLSTATKGEESGMIPETKGPTEVRVLLIGASIGSGWEFPELPRRTGLFGYHCEYVGTYDFDKGPLLDEALRGDNGPPDLILLKECAAYFPGELDRYKQLVRSWVARCREAGVELVLATVVPVAPKRTAILKLKAWVKRLLSGREGRNEQLRAYNDWLREFGEKEGIEILDLEAALRISAEDRSLKEEYDAGDGLHVNGKAYEQLDRVVVGLLVHFARREG